MPELPDLEAVKSILNAQIVGVKIERVEVLQPLVIRHPTPEEFVSTLTGNTISAIERRGKYLLFKLDSGHIMALHLMLVGRLQYCEASANRKPKTCFILHLEGGKQLRYFDSKLMGKVYLVEKKGKLTTIPLWKEMGPDALDDEVTPEVFQQRIKRYSGQVKEVLLSDKFLTGIGNAYADEILFEAGIYPFWPRKSLSDEEIEKLYYAMKSVLTESTEIVKDRMKDDISVEIRDFLKIHRREGKPCPVCGRKISQVQANRRITSYCRDCQRA
jgi:formamidopyrimidine-DNA glycosylase